MPTTIKAAIKKWEEATGKKAAEAKEIKLIGVYPPIGKENAQKYCDRKRDKFVAIFSPLLNCAFSFPMHREDGRYVEFSLCEKHNLIDFIL